MVSDRPPSFGPPADQPPVGALAAPAPHLRRELGLFGASLAGVGIILGAGIYVLIGEAAGVVGAFVWISFLLAAGMTACTGLSYAELAAMFPRAGASFEYTREAFGLPAGFVTGWLIVVAEVVAAGAVALGFGGYLDSLAGVDRQLGAVLLLAFGAVIAASGILGSVRVAGALTVVETAGLLLVSGIGLVDFDAARLTEGAPALDPILSGAALIFFAYIGFEELATFAEEVRDPRNTIPRAIVLAIVITTALYILVAVTAVAAVGATALAASDAPLADVARIVLGRATGDVLAVIALAATANTALLLLMASCRHVYSMGRAGALPAGVARLSGGTGVPVVGLAVVTAIAAGVTFWGDVGAIANMTNFAFFVVFIMVNGAVIALRWTRPAAPRPFHTPGRVPWPGRPPLPLLPAVGILTSLVLIISLEGEAIAGGAALLGLGILLAALLYRRGRLREGRPRVDGA